MRGVAARWAARKLAQERGAEQTAWQTAAPLAWRQDAARRPLHRRPLHRRPGQRAPDGDASTRSRRRARRAPRAPRPRLAFRRGHRWRIQQSVPYRARAPERRSAQQCPGLPGPARKARGPSDPPDRAAFRPVRSPCAASQLAMRRGAPGPGPALRSAPVGSGSRAAVRASAQESASASAAARRVARSAQLAAGRCRTAPAPRGRDRRRRGGGERLTMAPGWAIRCPARAQARHPQARGSAQPTAIAPLCCFARNSCPSL